jgi:uncharacterized membrane protein YqgA involved in biofilm formation
MLGTFVNVGVIVVCSLAGCFLKKGISGRFEEHIRKALGLAMIFLGIKGALDNENMLLFIMSMAIGSVIGELIDIDKWMNRLGLWAEHELGMGAQGQADTGRSFAKGFMFATILFCTGPMAIVGPMQSGLQGNHEILFAKSILESCMALIFGASLGIGVAFSVLPMLACQVSIMLAAQAVSGYLTEDIIREMSAVGGLVIAGIGFNFLGVKEIKVANMIPAIFIPWLWLTVASLF